MLPDYIYETRVYVDISLLPRGTGGTLLAQNNSNIGGVGPTQTAGAGPFAQTMRFQQRELVPNAEQTPPTAANFTTAITSAANDIGSQITASVLATIQNWATGQQ
jgi:hypothetical protein